MYKQSLICAHRKFLQFIKLCAIMSILNNLPSMSSLLQNTKDIFKNLVHFNQYFNPADEKVEKENVNDITRVSESKILEDSFQSNDSEILIDLSGRRQEVNEIGLGLFSSHSKKSHLQVVYYNSEGAQVSSIQGKKVFSNEQTESRKRRRQYQVQTEEDERSHLLKKYINNQGIPIERVNNYAQIHTVAVENHLNVSFKDDSMDETIFKITLQPKPKQKLRETGSNCIKAFDLPYLADFQINYSIEEIQNMTYKQITNISKLSIKNQWGKIQFLQPVSLFRRDLDQCISLSLHQIKIMDPEWKTKQIRFTPSSKVLRSGTNLNKMTRLAANLGLTKSKYDHNGYLTFTCGKKH